MCIGDTVYPGIREVKRRPRVGCYSTAGAQSRPIVRARRQAPVPGPCLSLAGPSVRDITKAYLRYGKMSRAVHALTLLRFGVWQAGEAAETQRRREEVRSNTLTPCYQKVKKVLRADFLGSLCQGQYYSLLRYLACPAWW